MTSPPTTAHSTGHETKEHDAHHRGHNAHGNPLAHVSTDNPDRTQAAFGGYFQPGLHAKPASRLANPAPLGLCGFALTTFVLSVIQMGAKDLTEPNIVVASAFAYGGLVQLLAGMWEMAAGNTFGATAFSSFGGFWISFAIILTPGGFEIVSSLEAAGGAPEFLNSFGIWLMGWFIFTFLMLLCTLRSTVMFFLLFFWLDIAFLLLGIGYLQNDGKAAQAGCIKAGGAFACLSAFWAWYNAFAGMADSSNSFFVPPVIHFPWSDKGREQRSKVNNDAARADQAV